MSARWRKLGAQPADLPYVNFYAKKLAEAGWSDGDIDEAVAFGLKHQAEGWDKFEGLAIHELQKRGIDGSVINEVLTPGDVILENPQVREALEAQSFAEAHANGRETPPSGDRIAEIERLMAEDQGRAYWNNPVLQQEYASLMEAREGGSAPASSPSPASNRKAEIEALMSTDGGRGYWTRPDIQSEFAAIVAAETQQEASQ